MRCYYSDTFVLPLPDAHQFPMTKYRLLREHLLNSGVVASEEMQLPPAATDTQLMRVHCPHYIQRIQEGTLSRDELRRIGFPWSPQMIERSRRSTGATIAASYHALLHRFSANLAGGTHHAFYDAGQGYCLFNDAVVAARELQASGRVRQVAIIDCDVHQGNGTAALVENDPSIFSFSIHCQRNFPLQKQKSDLDIGVERGITDEPYLQQLSVGLNMLFERFSPDLIIYLAGADPFENDRLGRLKLTLQGLRQRDELVFQQAASRQLPIAVAMAGGYSPRVEEIVEIHAQTIRVGAEMMLGKS